MAISSAFERTLIYRIVSYSLGLPLYSDLIAFLRRAADQFATLVNPPVL